MSETGLLGCQQKMLAAGVETAAITVFTHYYRQVEQGISGWLPESQLQPVTQLPKLENLPPNPAGANTALKKTALIRLNGGLGTSMGLAKAKSLLPVRNGQTFLDLICQQVLSVRKQTGAPLPLVFMNSFRTEADTRQALAKYPQLPVAGLPLDFRQNQIPKIWADSLTPAEWPTDPTLEWCPPGHGDIYVALQASGVLEKLLAAGFEYVNVANSDNLGAVPDGRLAAWFARSKAPFAMEVCRRTANDRKGGHLALRRQDGQLVLRESAQTPPEDKAYFADEHRHCFFNTNNLWLNLPRLVDALRERDGVLGLPLIVNRKPIDPTDPESPPVLQLETAMGAAVEVFPGAQAIEVPRSRFLPVKTTNELALLRSDCYSLAADGAIRLAPAPVAANGSPVPRQVPIVDLDPQFFGQITAFEQRFAQGMPSLQNVSSWQVRGDWHFPVDSRLSGAAVARSDGSSSGIVGAVFNPSSADN